MAFVFRSPRDLHAQPQGHYESQVKEPPAANSQNQQQVVKKPMKGPAFPRRDKKGELAGEIQLMKEITNQESEAQLPEYAGESKKVLSKNHSGEQYFFKSKIKRGGGIQKQSADRQEDTRVTEMSLSEANLNEKISKRSPKNKKNGHKSEAKLQSVLVKDKTEKNLPVLMSKQLEKAIGKNLNLIHSKQNNNQAFSVPSIPGKMEKFGFVVKDNKFKYPEKVSRPRFEGEKDDRPGPTDYTVDAGTKKVIGPKLASPHRDRNEQKQALINLQEALRIHNQKIKQSIEESKVIRKQSKNIVYKKVDRQDLKTRDLSTGSDESGETVYDDQTTPGPGYYQTIDCDAKKSFRSKNDHFQKIFISKQQRFSGILKQNNSEITASCFYDDKLVSQASSASWKKNFFMSKLKRELKLQTESQSPPPGHYDARVSMQNDVITKILRNSPNLFQNNIPRLISDKIEKTPGPGEYETHPANFKVESNKKSIKELEKKSMIGLKFEKVEKSLICQRKQVEIQEPVAIHQKQDSPVEQKNYAPFLSSSPKLKSQKSEGGTTFSKPNLLREQRRQKQNMHPFNSTEARSRSNDKIYIAESGLYEHSPEWHTKSYNILFN